jgi:uncharacterized membrane-anchored protein YitT (DUF2179 family)
VKYWKRELRNFVLIVLAVFSAGMGIHGFLLSSRFIDGGVTGISMLISSVVGWPLPLLIAVINLPFIAVGYRLIGPAFAVRSVLAIGGLAVCLATVPFPDVTPDKLLTAVFGGFFLGAGIGLAIRGGAVLDGTEIAALIICRQVSILRVADVILGVNIAIFLTAAFFLGAESALYSILTYFAASKTLDFILHGLEEFTAITIMSEKSEAIRQAITNELRRGLTVYKGRGGVSGAEQEILMCVVTRLEIGKMKTIVKEHDRDAFIMVHSLSDVSGGMHRKKSLF